MSMANTQDLPVKGKENAKTEISYKAAGGALKSIGNSHL